MQSTIYFRSTLKDFLSTQPADRVRAEKTLLEYHASEKLYPTPQFIWCGSPQSAIIMAKIVADLYESTLPVTDRPSKSNAAQKFGNRAPISLTETYISQTALPVVRNMENLVRRVNTPTELSGSNSSLSENLSTLLISDQISSAIIFNPPVELWQSDDFFYRERKKGSQEIVEVAMNSCEPHLSELRLNKAFLGVRPKLVFASRGQHAVIRGHSNNRKGKSQISLSTEMHQSCGWVWDYNHTIFISERTDIASHELTNSGTRLHSLHSPAIRWPDGTSIYVIHGVLVPDFIVTNPKRITIFRINQETNVEVRRIMMDRYKSNQYPSGIAAYLLDSGSDIIDHDERWGTLHYLRQLNGDEDIVMLEVVNRSPEPDGSYKHYFLRVPPDTISSREAVAWTFGFNSPDEYEPLQET